jgi:23S rRNA pseudouridine2605 synthase
MAKGRSEHDIEDGEEAETGGPIRLQRALAMAGLGSRRKCEELILEGRVEVDDEPVVQLGTRVDPEVQKITVDGERLKLARFQYYAVYKPVGVLSTNYDPSGRTRVIDLIKTDYRVYNVGRLDQSSEGLILVTNDGDLANRLTHPKYGIEKTYLVQTVGVPTPEQLSQLEKGVYLAEGKAKAKSVKLIKRNKVGAILEMVLTEGRNREIRRLLARLGHKVTRLQRVAIGPLGLGPMGVGEHRKLTLEEVRALKEWRPKIESLPKPKRSAKRFGRPSGDKNQSSRPRRLPGRDDDSSAPARFGKKPNRSKPGEGDRKFGERKFGDRKPGPRKPTSKRPFGDKASEPRSGGKDFLAKREGGDRARGKGPSRFAPRREGSGPPTGRPKSDRRGKPNRPFGNKNRGPRNPD